MSNLTSWWVWAGGLFKANVNQVWLSRTVRHFRSGTSETDTLSAGAHCRWESTFDCTVLKSLLNFPQTCEKLSTDLLWFNVTMKRGYCSSCVKKCLNYAEGSWNKNIRCKIWKCWSSLVRYTVGNRKWWCIVRSRRLLWWFFFPLVKDKHSHLSIQYPPFPLIHLFRWCWVRSPVVMQKPLIEISKF